MIHYLKLIRIEQWIKNGFLFLPIFFDNQLTNTDAFGGTTLAAFAFAFLSSAVYIFNDYRDRNADRLHPKKRNRPIASGAISVSNAFVVLGIMLLVSAGICWYLSSISLAYVLVLYLLMNLGYSSGLKHIAILDIFILSFGYVLRVYAGGFASEIEPSKWLTLMTFLLALFLSLSKRRDDVAIFEASGTKMRKGIEAYNMAFLNTSISVIGGILVVAYSMYVLSPETEARFNSPYIYFTIIFVLAGVLRYMQITLVEKNSGSPTGLLYKDRFLQVTIALWLLSLMSIIYF